MNLVVTALSWVALMTGCGLVLTGGIGMVRFPDAYTRMHATSLTDTLGSALILGGLMLQSGFSLVTVKLALVMGFLLFTAPVATHAFGQTALQGGLRPLGEVHKPGSGDRAA